MLAVVDLPDPEGPTKATVDFAGIVIDTLSTEGCSFAFPRYSCFNVPL